MDQLLAMRVFTRVVESGSFTRAADHLQLPKASVSQHLARLEAHLGVRLLHRTTRQLRLTDDGEAYYQRAHRLLDELDDLDASLGDGRHQPRGRLRVDVPAAYGRHVLVPALPDFLARYPALRLELGSSDRPVNLLQEGVDCVIRGGELHDDGLIGRRLPDLAVITCASPGYLARAGVPEHPEALRAHALIGYFSARSGRPYAMDFTRDGTRIELEGPYRVALNDADSYLAAGLAGLGVLQLPRSSLVDRHLAAGDLVPVLMDWNAEPLTQHILYPSRRHLSHCVRVFIDWVVAHLGR